MRFLIELGFFPEKHFALAEQAADGVDTRERGEHFVEELQHLVLLVVLCVSGKHIVTFPVFDHLPNRRQKIHLKAFLQHGAMTLTLYPPTVEDVPFARGAYVVHQRRMLGGIEHVHELRHQVLGVPAAFRQLGRKLKHHIQSIHPWMLEDVLVQQRGAADVGLCTDRLLPREPFLEWQLRPLSLGYLCCNA